MAEDNIKLVETKNDMMWFKDSPVIICSFRVAVDMTTGDMFTSAKFLNIAPYVIRDITFDVVCYNQAREPIGYLTNITFSDIDAQRNTNFGYHRKIEITDLDTRNVEYIIRSVTYDNGNAWTNTQNRRFDTRIDQESIYTVQGDYNKQFRDICARSGIDGMNLVLQPVFTEDYWLCACGTFNWNDETMCSQCSVNREWLTKNTDPEALRQRKENQDAQIQLVREQVKAREFAAAESKDAERLEFEQRSAMLEKELKKEKSHKRKKYMIWGAAALLVLAVLLYCLMTFVFPKFLSDDSSEESSSTSKVSCFDEMVPGADDIFIYL